MFGQEVTVKKSQFTENQIVPILNEADANVMVKDICRKYGISDATYYKWKSKYGGLSVSDLKRLRELETENRRLKKMYADLSLENDALKELLTKSSNATGTQGSGIVPGGGEGSECEQGMQRSRSVQVKLVQEAFMSA